MKENLAERFFRTLSNKSNNIVNKCNNTHHRTIKMKPPDIKPSIYLDLNK